MIIDFHTHAFPEKIVTRAMESLIHKGGALVPFTDGTPAGLLQAMDRSGVDRAVVLNIATNVKQIQSVNDFVAGLDDRLIGFGSVYPGDIPYALEELERIHQLGLKGIKLHPAYQQFFVDDPKMAPIYQKAAALGLITVFHAGEDIGYDLPVHCTPQRLARALEMAENWTVVAAHMGGYLLWHDVERYLLGKNLYIDTSLAHGRLPAPQAKRMIRAHGADRVLLGSDCPWGFAKYEIGYIKSLGLEQQEQEQILGGNAARLLGL